MKFKHKFKGRRNGTTKTANHPKPPKTIRNHPQPTRRYPKAAAISLKLPKTTRKLPPIVLD